MPDLANTGWIPGEDAQGNLTATPAAPSATEAAAGAGGPPVASPPIVGGFARQGPQIDPRAFEELERKVELLGMVISRMRDDPTASSAIEGAFTLHFPIRIAGPNGVQYWLARTPGGLMVASNEPDAWSDE